MSTRRDNPRTDASTVTKETDQMTALTRFASALRSRGAAASGHGVRRRWALFIGLGGSAFLLLAGAAPTLAAAPAPGWAIKAMANPTQFSSADTTGCNSYKRCDRYDVLVTNVGAAATSGTIEIVDTLPAAGVALPTGFNPLRASDLRRNQEEEETAANKIECSSAGLTVTCTYTESLPPGETLAVSILVETASSSEPLSLEDRAEVKGGGALAPVSTTVHNRANEPALPGFELVGFGMGAYGQGGEVEAQAGGRPETVTSSYQVASAFDPASTEESTFVPIENPKTLTVELPLGLIGDPLAAAKCPEAELAAKPETPSPGFSSMCPSDSRIGTVVPSRQNGSPGYESSQMNDEYGQTPSVSGLYNMQPEAGYPAVFGFRFISAPVLLYTRVVPTPQGYRLRVSAANIPHGAGGFQVLGALLTFFGVPNMKNGVVGGTPQAFFRNPTSCASTPQELSMRIEANTWVKPGHVVTEEEPVYPGGITGCNMLQFNPELKVRPEQTQADTPTGYEVKLKVPQSELSSERGTADLRDATVTLPKGVSLSPSAANGLEGCSEAELDPLGTEVGEGHPGGNESPYDDGLEHASPGHCPPASKVGQVEVKTPLLGEPLQGSVYLAQPQCGGGQRPCTEADATNGKLYGVYLEISGSGVILKLKGKVAADPQTGQLTTSFEENPQLPFEELKLTLDHGPRAPLANPQTCGTYTTTSDLKPWSAPAGPDATPSSPFGIASGPGGGACANSEAEEPNKPSFEAGTLTPIAGSYSPFILHLRREDGSQRIKGIAATLPPGLVGKLAGVPYCPEAALAAAAARTGTAERANPSCPLASQVGVVNVGAGPGPSPFYAQGKVYLAGPYKGAPLSLAVITPAVAGPFDLGTVLVRNALYVNPETAQIHAVSDPIPTILDGIPLDVRDIHLNIDRPNFTLNPTSCDPLAVNGTALSVLGQSAPLSDRFQVGACKALGFKPSLSLKVTGATRRGSHPALRAVLKARKGDANIARAAVTLPHSEFLENAHIKTICTRVQFAEGQVPGERCPAGSIYGHARAITPLLDRSLEGPVYLRSSSHELPDLVAALNGQIQVVLDGKVDTGKGGGIRNTFEVVPDAPVSKFTLSMQGGKKGLIVNSENLCSKKTKKKALALFTAHNGKLSNTKPVLKPLGCKRHGKHHKAAHHKRQR